MKVKVKVIFAAIILIAAVGVSSAQNANQTQDNQPRKTCFVDVDKNGVCDSFEKGTCTIGNGKGLCNGSRHKNGNGQGYRSGKRDGSGRANGGKGMNYIDANNDGICDYREKVDKK